jgi:capsular polysaccharide biosynthesis protein
MEDTIHFRYILFVLRKRMLFVFLMILSCTLFVTLISYLLITPVYEAETEILVNNSDPNSPPTSVDIETSILLIDTYSIIIKSHRVMEVVATKIGREGQASQISKKVKIVKVNNSQIFKIVVEDPDPQMAVLIANTVAETFESEIIELLNTNSIHVLTPAKMSVDPKPTNPNLLMIAFFTFFASTFIAAGLAFLLEKMNAKFYSNNEITELLQLPIIGKVHRFSTYQIEESKD